MCTNDALLTTYAALRAGGLSRRRLEAALHRGEWMRLRTGTYATTDVCTARRTAARHGGTLACVTAARHVGLWVRESEAAIHVWMPAHGHVFRHSGCACTSHWDEAPSVDAFGLPSIPRILLQIAECFGVEDFFASLESAMNQRMLHPHDLRWLRARVGPAYRDAVDFAGCDAQSGLESIVRWRLRPLGVHARSQVAITGVGIVDLLIGDRLIIELDGRQNHDTRTHRHKDLERDAAATIWGYVTLRFDYAMVIHDWPFVEHAIRAAVAAGEHRR